MVEKKLIEANNQMYSGILIGGIFPEINHNGITYEDFRGFVLDRRLVSIPDGQTYELRRENTPQAANCDFSYSTTSEIWSAWCFRSLSSCVFRKCVFLTLQLQLEFLSCDFYGSKMQRCQLGWAKRAKFIQCNFSKCNLQGSKNHHIYFEKCDFSRANMKYVFFGGSTFNNCSFEEAKLVNANFSGATFRSCNLNGADFSTVWCPDAQFFGCAPNRLDKVRGEGAIIKP